MVNTSAIIWYFHVYSMFGRCFIVTLILKCFIEFNWNWIIYVLKWEFCVFLLKVRSSMKKWFIDENVNEFTHRLLTTSFVICSLLGPAVNYPFPFFYDLCQILSLLCFIFDVFTHYVRALINQLCWMGHPH